MLKSSSTLGVVQTIGRFMLSLFPVMWVKTRVLGFMSKLIDVEKHPQLAAKQALYALRSQRLQYFTFALIAVPFGLIGLTALASSERTPLTGRWRVILLSPAEEEAISSDLQGHKWYDTVRDILAQSSGTGQAPPILAQGDWRWTWVDQTLRRLERAVLILHNIEGYREAYEQHLMSQEGDQVLYPPPPKYPLLPRGRASTLLHEMPVHSDADHEKGAEAAAHHSHHVAPHTLLGPPYALLVVNKDESNAFSYGFGPKGAGGVVVYSGFLDDILDRKPANQQVSQPPTPPPASRSLWSSVFGSASPPAPSPPPLSQVGPTPEQTSKLATLLAHELSHLVLSHHIETLSKGTILFPSVVSIAVDTIRSLLYPLTFVVGPFFGDALDRTLRMGLDDLAKAGESCTNTSLEIEADIISARILALAGFDPRVAIEFWEERMDDSPPQKGKNARPKGNEAHPVGKERIQALKDELLSWEVERARTLKKLQQKQTTLAAV
ncbi:hypothetical protein M407DRAFT_245803 [Tulasnella calospora MUT 4182]|uniref:Peptidase M48 domain-containing protein n=1 Tax=Tulasnella calospora MUT 4182 TaxID=1051891 RepID=A0A0C3LG87_9AGAM|nr:hypothetical protein M407DRAFT_245803 [Tulasnella calospora MUT 4182]